jgi:hypothetical protein
MTEYSYGVIVRGEFHGATEVSFTSEHGEVEGQQVCVWP